MRRFFTSLLLTLTFTFVSAQSEGFLHALFPSPASDEVLGKEVEVQKHISNVQLATYPSGEILTLFRYQYTVNQKGINGLTLFKKTGAGDSLWTKSIDFGEDFISEWSRIDLIATLDGGAVVALSVSINHELKDILLKLDSMGNLLWAKNIEPSDNIRTFRVDLLEKDNGDLILAQYESYFNHYNQNNSFSGVSLLRFNSTGTFQDRTHYFLRTPAGRFSTPMLSLNASGELLVAGSYNGPALGNNDPHQTATAIFKADNTGNIVYEKVLFDQNDFRPMSIAAIDSGLLIGMTGYFPAVLSRINGSGDIDFTQIYTSEDYNFNEHTPFRLIHDEAGSSIMAYNADFVSDVLIDLSQGLAAPHVRIDLDPRGNVLKTETQPGGSSFSGQFDVARGDSGEVVLAYASYFYEEPQGDFDLAINLSKTFPASKDSSVCGGEELSTVAHDGIFQENSLDFEGPFTDAQIAALVGSPIPLAINNQGISLADDNIRIVSLCGQIQEEGNDSLPPLPTTTPSLIATYPNPTNGEMTLSMGADMGEVELRIQDLSGRIFMEKRMVGEKGASLEMDMSGMEAGIYILTVKGQDFMVRKKLVKAD